MLLPGKQTYWSLQAGRGIAAILVVLYHTAAIMGTAYPYWRVPLLHQRFSGLSLGVEFFFVLSGAVIFLAHQSDIGHPATIPAYLWKRFRRVYPIYWIVLTGVLVSYAWQPNLISSSKASRLVIASNVLLVHLGTLEVNLNVAWTLFHETLFYAVFALFLVRRKLGLIALGLWCMFCTASAVAHGPAFLHEYLLAPVNLLFAFGAVAAWILRTRRVVRPAIFASVGAALLAAAIAFACIRFNLGVAVQYVAGVGAALLILGTARLEEVRRLVVPQPLRFLGAASYAIYLIHFPILQLAAPAVYRAHPAPLLIPLFELTILATTGGCVLHLFVERPLLRLLTLVPRSLSTREPSHIT